MDQELIDFITNYIELAKFRNVSFSNPIRFEIQPERSNPNRKFIVVVSPLEPTFSKLPYNLLWIPSDPNHPAFSTMQKRSGHIASDIYNATWENITTYAELWLPDQYYTFVVEDPRNHGIDSEDTVVGPASATDYGLVVLSDDQVDSIIVEESDPRNTNARYPNFHSHPDFPRTKVKINESDYALVSTSAPPQQGMMLFIVGQSSDKVNEYIAVWRFPIQNDLVVVDRSLLAITITGATSMVEQSMQGYIVTAVYADLTEAVITPNSFTVSDTGIATLDLGTGVLSVGNIVSGRSLTLTAEYTEGGITVSDTHLVDITVGTEITSLQIVGPDTVQENSGQQYIVRAFFNDGSQQDVVADTIESTIAAFATIDGAAMLSALEVNGGDKNTVLNASYEFDGVTRTASKTVTIVDLDPLVVNITINGLSVLAETEVTAYTFTLEYSDGSEITNAIPATFTQSPGSYSALDDQIYQLTAGSVSQDRIVRLDASFEEFGRTVTGFLNVTITDTPAVPVSAIIIGNATIPEQDTSVYQIEVTYDDASTQLFSNGNWVMTSGATYASVQSSGLVTGADITEDQPVELGASITVSTVEFTGLTLDITILAEAPVLVSLEVSAPGGTSASEADTVVLTYIATYSDGATVNVKTSPQLQETFVGNANGSTFVGADSNDVLMGEVVGNQSITVRGSYTEDGVTVNDTVALGIVDSDVTPRWGMAPEQNLSADYLTPAFYDLLTNSLSGINNEALPVSFPDVGDGSSNHGYVLYPASWGYAFITNLDINFSGGWDFAAFTTNDATMADLGAFHVTLNGTLYYLYRTDFQQAAGITNYKIEYGGASRMSGSR